ncbi:MAG: hypothetical protein FWG14_02070 [Peptococcaceae bacterium]|nr:hypothetical protein [Peptococcaceae bacterium]
MENKINLVSQIEELGHTTIEAIEHAAVLAEREDGDALATLPIMTEVLEAFYAIGEALPMTLSDEEEDEQSQEPDSAFSSVDEAFATLVEAYEYKDVSSVRNTLKDEVLPLYKYWFNTVKGSLPHMEQ